MKPEVIRLKKFNVDGERIWFCDVSENHNVCNGLPEMVVVSCTYL